MFVSGNFRFNNYVENTTIIHGNLTSDTGRNVRERKFITMNKQRKHPNKNILSALLKSINSSFGLLKCF